MIEVFKTNVSNRGDANKLIEHIQQSFFDYQCNFDLEDCDQILRVKSTTGSINSSFVIDLLKDFGFDAEVLPDYIPLAGILDAINGLANPTERLYNKKSDAIKTVLLDFDTKMKAPEF